MNGRKRLKGSDVCLVVMFAGWVWYVEHMSWLFIKTGSWPPLEFTACSALLFLFETWALYKLKIAKEGGKTTRDALNRTEHETSTVKEWIGSKLGLSGMPTLDVEIDEALEGESK